MSSADERLSDQQLAERLVEMRVLNTWQAGQLLQGRTKFNLGPYQIVDSIGQGGMGQVFKAQHSVMGRVVAIKVLPRSKSTPEAITNFTREIRALASLDHKRLVRALDAGHDGNVYYLVTEYVPGCDLRKLVRREGPLSMRAAASIMYQVAEGLEHAHRQGLIHRDVKPGNVLVTPEGEAKLSDLGLAGPSDADAENDPRFGKIVGTADYLSPDHIESPWEPTPAWDIYSLGCTLYYAVTGKVPFPGGTTADKARAHLELRPLDPRRLNVGLCDEFVDLMADMMAKAASERVPSAVEVMRRLRPWISVASVGDEYSPPNGRPGPTAPGAPPALPHGPPAQPIPISDGSSRVTPPPVVSVRPVSPPPVAVPPPVRRLPSRAASQNPPANGHVPTAEAESVFAEISDEGSDSGGSGSLIVPTKVVRRRGAGEVADAEVDFDASSEPVSIIRPLVVLVLTPLLMVATVIVIWLLVRKLF